MSKPVSSSLLGEPWDKEEWEALQRLAGNLDFRSLRTVLGRHVVASENRRNELLRPENDVADPHLTLRQQAYWQGYADALMFVIRLPEVMAQATVGEHGELDLTRTKEAVQR